MNTRYVTGILDALRAGSIRVNEELAGVYKRGVRNIALTREGMGARPWSQNASGR